MRDYSSEEKQKRIELGVAAFLFLLLIIVVLVVSPFKKEEEVETSDTEVITTETGETDTTVEVLEEASPSNVTHTTEEAEKELGLPDDVIRELKDKQVKEGITPEQNAEAWEKALKENIAQTTPQESTMETVEASTEASIEGETTPLPTAESDGRDFNIVDPKKPTINADGEITKDITEKVKDAMVPGSGPNLIQNDSTSMKVGKTIKNYYNTDYGKGQVGDTVMFNEIGLRVKPILSEPGYEIKTYNDTAEVTFGKRGIMYITKVPDLDVTQLSMAQVQELGGIAQVSEYNCMNPVGGSYTQYSYLAISNDFKRAIQYYKCGFGTYQLLYISSGGPNLVTTIVANTEPDETINAMAPLSSVKTELD